MLDLTTTVQMLDRYEGRDKLCKILQHFSAILFRLTKSDVKDYDYYNDNMFFGMYKSLSISRQYLRLFKSLQELKHFRDLIRQKNSNDEFDRLINTIIRFIFIFYWFYDNLTLLCRHGFLEKNKTKIQQKSMDFRLYGLTLSLLLHTRNLIRCHHQEIQVRQQLPYLKDEHENIQASEEIKRIRIQKAKNKLVLLKTVGDSFLSFAGTKLADNWFKRIFPKIMVNIGGLVSGLITCHFIYTDLKKIQKQKEYESHEKTQSEEENNIEISEQESPLVRFPENSNYHQFNNTQFLTDNSNTNENTKHNNHSKYK